MPATAQALAQEVPVPERKLPRYVELIRVSGTSQAKRNTPAEQRRYLIEMRTWRPGLLVEVIDDGAVGLSGANDFADRPDLQRLKALCEARLIDEVRVRHLDRLTRHEDPVERAYILSMLRKAGVLIIRGGSELDPRTVAGEILWTVESIAAAEERKKIQERTVPKRKAMAAQGLLVCGTPPYARVWDPVAKKWDVDPERMAIYKRVIAELLAGISTYRLAIKFTEESIPTPRTGRKSHKSGVGCQWNTRTITHLVNSRSVIGEFPQMGSIVQVPPVATPEDWERAKAMIKGRRRGRPSTAPAVSAVLRGIAVCGVCGSRLYVKRAGGQDPYYYYVCKHHRTARTSDCRKFHSVKEIDPGFAGLLADFFERECLAAAGVSKEDAVEALKNAERQLAELDGEYARLLKALRKAKSPEAEKDVEHEMEQVDQEREAARRAIEKAQAQVDAPPAPIALDPKKRAKVVRELRSDETAPERVREIVLGGLLPGQVAIHPDGRVAIRGT